MPQPLSPALPIHNGLRPCGSHVRDQTNGGDETDRGSGIGGSVGGSEDALWSTHRRSVGKGGLRTSDGPQGTPSPRPLWWHGPGAAQRPRVTPDGPRARGPPVGSHSRTPTGHEAVAPSQRVTHLHASTCPRGGDCCGGRRSLWGRASVSARHTTGPPPGHGLVFILRGKSPDSIRRRGPSTLYIAEHVQVIAIDALTPTPTTSKP